MKQIIEIMRLRYDLNCSQQNIADSMGIPRGTIRDYLIRVKAAGLSWPLPDDMTNERLNALIFTQRVEHKAQQRPEPDWSYIQKELKRKSVTLQLLWEEYKKQHPQGYQYSWFAERYKRWATQHDVWMPQQHKAGEKTFVDYSGLKVPIWSTNLQTIKGEAEIFVSVLGGSDLIFCTATKTQQVTDWIEAHNRMVNYYGGVTDLMIPDNLRSAVTKAHRYEPQCQSTYEEWAQHYQCAVMPTRRYSPKDKAKVEKAVQLVQQRVLAPLRHEKFCSLASLNQRITSLLDALNQRFSKTYGRSRRALFDSIEKATLKPLPAKPYELALWQQQRVNGGYHVVINRHHYSVPYQFVRKTVDIRITEQGIEVFYRDERIACHQRMDDSGGYSTIDSHRPEGHRQQAQWNHQRLQAWANQIGDATTQLICRLFTDEKHHLHQKERSAIGILRLSHAYSDSALEAACQQALQLGTQRYDSLLSLIKRQSTLPLASNEDNLFESSDHDNVRGSDYYH